jgi:hypothetical protein
MVCSAANIKLTINQLTAIPAIAMAAFLSFVSAFLYCHSSVPAMTTIYHSYMRYTTMISVVKDNKMLIIF